MDIGYSNEQLLGVGSIELGGDSVTFSPDGDRVRVVLVTGGREFSGFADGGEVTMEGNKSAGILVGVMLMNRADRARQQEADLANLADLEARRARRESLVSVMMAPQLPDAVQGQLEAIGTLLQGIANRHPEIAGFEVQGDFASGFRVVAVGGAS